MINDDYHIKLIEDWYDEKLSIQQKKEFDKLVTTDQNFVNKLAKYKLARKAIHALGVENINEKVNKWNTELNSIPKAPKSNLSKYWIIGSTILLFIFYLLYINYSITTEKQLSIDEKSIDTTKLSNESFLNDTSQVADSVPIRNQENIHHETTQQLALRYLRSFPSEVYLKYGTKMGADDSTNLEVALKYIEEKKIKQADSILLNYNELNSNYAQAQEILALVYLTQKKYTLSINAYKNYAKIHPSPISDLRLAQFYLLEYNKYYNELANLLDKMTNRSVIHLYQEKGLEIRKKLTELNE